MEQLFSQDYRYWLIIIGAVALIIFAIVRSRRIKSNTESASRRSDWPARYTVRLLLVDLGLLRSAKLMDSLQFIPHHADLLLFEIRVISRDQDPSLRIAFFYEPTFKGSITRKEFAYSCYELETKLRGMDTSMDAYEALLRVLDPVEAALHFELLEEVDFTS